VDSVYRPIGITLPLSGRQGLHAGARHFEEACPLKGLVRQSLRT
jgi:hypothetical protein